MPQDDELRNSLAKLIIAHHILHNEGVLTSAAGGGVSVRNPLNHNVFFSSDEMGTAPILVEGLSDLRGWTVGDGKSYCRMTMTVLIAYEYRSFKYRRKRRASLAKCVC